MGASRTLPIWARRSAWRRFLIAAAAVISAATMAGAAAPTDGDSLWGKTIVAVRFESAGDVDARSVAAMLPLRIGAPLEAADVAAARRMLDLKDLWSGIEVDLVPGGTGVEVVFRLQRARTVGAVRVVGQRHFGSSELLRRARIDLGARLDDALLAAAAPRLRDMYARQGYDQATVEVRSRPRRDREVEVTFVISEGSPLRIGAIDIEGDLVVSPGVLRSALSARPGQRYERGLERSILAEVRRYYRQRRYYGVSVGATWKRDPEERTGVILLRVNPGPLHEVVFTGSRFMSRGRLLGLLDLFRRPVVTDGTWRELAKRISRAYRESGYYRARVDLHIGTGNPRRIEFVITEGARYALRHIEFAGAQRVPPAQLQAQMRTRPKSWVPFRRGGVLVDEILDDDLRKLWFLYRRLGFHAAEILDARPSLDEAESAIDLTIEVDEGPRSLVRRIEFEGFSEEVLMPVLATRENEPYDPETLGPDRAALAAAVARLGFPEAVVTATVTAVRAGEVVETMVRFGAVSGPGRRLGPVIVQGNQLTRDRAVLRELPFKEGDPFDPNALQRGQDALSKLGLFRRVNVRPIGEAKAPAPAIGVRVDERSPGTLQYGFGYSTSLGFRAFGEAAYDNVQGMARRLSLRGEFNLDPQSFEPDDYLGNLGFRAPRVFDTRWMWRTNAILQRSTRDVDRFALQRSIVITALERELAARLTGGVEAEFEQADVFDTAADLAGEGVGFLRTTTFGPFFVWDRRDDAFAPRRGLFDSLRVRYGPPALASDLHFVRVVAQHTHYVPLTADVGLVYAARAGWARTLRAAQVVPLRERFFLGGRTTVRGFDENGIGPLGSLGSPRGGDLTVNLNTELRFPLWFGLSGAVFVDGGGVYLQREVMSTHDFRRSAGAGLRYLTPVGPISVEYGVKLDQRAGESVGALHFTIGNIF